MSRNVKISLNFTNIADLASFFRIVADRIEGTESSSDEVALPDIEGFEKMELKVKQGGFNSLKLKMKTKIPDLCEDPLIPPLISQSKPSYKKLKKRMDISYSEIKQALANGVFPLQDVLTSFLVDSEVMMSYKGKGDDFYPAYRAACNELKTAFEEPNNPKMLAAFEKLKAQKASCHDLYK